MPRARLTRDLRQPLPAPTADPYSRPVQAADAPALAALLLDAYRGTIDDCNEGPEEADMEVNRLFSGQYGRFDFQSSEVTERANAIVAATLVTSHEGSPFIAFSITAAHCKRMGLARNSLLRTMHRVAASGATSIHLVVTRGNTPAERLYASLGFVEHPL